MMFDKLDKTREQAVVTAIEKIIDRSRHAAGESLNKIAADVLAESDGMTPQLARRACEAFNKSKSVYTLQKRAGDDRAEDFDLIDADAVHDIMYGYHQKAASQDFTMPVRDSKDNIPELREKLRKVALDASEAPEPLQDPSVIEREIMRTSTRLNYSVDKLRECVGMHKQASEDAIHRACQVIRRLHSKNLSKVAHHVVNRYGDDGVRLLKLINAYTDKDMPLEKTAAAAIFPLREPYTSIAIAVDEARAYARSNAMLEKTADFMSEAGSAARGTTKSALTGIRRLLDPAISFAKSPIYGQVTKEHREKDDEAFDATLRNQLQQLRATQAFVDIASDDYIKDYGIDDTIQAYNNVVGSMPELLDEKYTAWLKALVREQLVQGNVYDANTIQQLQAIGKEIKKGRTADIDEAMTNLEAGKGGVKPGMEVVKPEEKKTEKKTEKKPEKKDDKLEREKMAQKEREMEQKAQQAEAAARASNRATNVREAELAFRREQAAQRQQRQGGGGRQNP